MDSRSQKVTIFPGQWGSVTESCVVFDPSCYDAAETILVSFGAWVI